MSWLKGVVRMLILILHFSLICEGIIQILTGQKMNTISLRLNFSQGRLIFIDIGRLSMLMILMPHSL